MKLDLIPRLECVLCGAGFERTPTDECWHEDGTGESTTGLCAGCGVGMDHGREFVRFWRLGFRDWNADKVRRHRGRDVPEHLAHAYDVGWAAAEAVANAENWESAPYWKRRGWCFGAGIIPLNGESVPTKAFEGHTAAFRAGRDALSKGTDAVLSALGLPPQKYLTADDLPEGPDQKAIAAYQRAVHEPLWPGHALSHATANVCVQRGWADRNSDGCFVATDAGRRRARMPVRCQSVFRGVQCAHGDGHSGPHEYVEAF